MNVNQWNRWSQSQSLQKGKPMRRAHHVALTQIGTEAELIQAAKAANLILMKTPTSYILYPTDHFQFLAGP
jgi:hypothetical protein